jgi:autotransporter-associated beta strand protein
LQFTANNTTDYSARFSQAANQTYAIDTNGQNINLASDLSSSNGSLAKQGAGTLTLGGNNTYSGATLVNSGTLTTSGADKISDSSAVTVNSGGTFSLGGNETVGSIAGAGDFSLNAYTLTAGGDNSFTTLSGAISGTGAVTKLGAGTLTLNGSNTYTGATTISAGTLQVGDGGTTGSLSSNITNNAALVFNRSDNSSYSGTISGSGAVTKAGNGTLSLTGNNTYTGATTLNAGMLNAAHANALGSNNTVTINDGTLLVSTDDAINGKHITLNGTSTTVATLAFHGNYNGTIGQLTLQKDSIIDLGQGNVGLQFADMVMGFYNLSIYNWGGTTQWGTTYGMDTDRMYFNGNYTASNVHFYSGEVGSDSFVGTGFDMGLQPTSWDAGLEGHYIIPVPEPETWATGLLLLFGGAVGLWRRQNHLTTIEHGGRLLYLKGPAFSIVVNPLKLCLKAISAPPVAEKWARRGR